MEVGKVGTDAEGKTKTNMRQAARFSLFNEVRQEELFLVPARRGDLRSLIQQRPFVGSRDQELFGEAEVASS